MKPSEGLLKLVVLLLPIGSYCVTSCISMFWPNLLSKFNEVYRSRWKRWMRLDRITYHTHFRRGLRHEECFVARMYSWQRTIKAVEVTKYDGGKPFHQPYVI